MKKRILFIISNMESGGVSKSMLSLLHTVDKKTYEVDLLVVNPTGIFMNQLPEGIKIISDEKAGLFFSSFPGNIPALLKKGFWLAAFARLGAAALSRIDRGWAGVLMSKFLPVLPSKYDLAVDYNGQQQLYYLIDKVSADKKVTFFHSDYGQWTHYFSADKLYFPKADRIFSISETCTKSLREFFPAVAEKVEVFENISSPAFIYHQAAEKIPENISGPVLLTVGHLSENKGTSLALGAAKRLKDKEIEFRWYFIGSDTGEKDYVKTVTEYGLQDYVFFLGLRSNPYPYMATAAIIVHPSKFEGKSIALDEAKILAKPVVVTNFTTVTDQFTHGYNASITDMNDDNLAAAIEDLLRNPELAAKYVENLMRDRIDNSGEINKLYTLLA